MSTEHYFDQIGALPHKSRELLWTYVFGFIFSLLLTLLAYLLVVTRALPNVPLAGVVAFLALIQFCTQAICFLHIGGKRSRERQFVLGCALVVAFILVSGSIWIMVHLNDRMTTDQMEQYMDDQGGF